MLTDSSGQPRILVFNQQARHEAADLLETLHGSLQPLKFDRVLFCTNVTRKATGYRRGNIYTKTCCLSLAADRAVSRLCKQEQRSLNGREFDCTERPFGRLEEIGAIFAAVQHPSPFNYTRSSRAGRRLQGRVRQFTDLCDGQSSSSRRDHFNPGRCSHTYLFGWKYLAKYSNTAESSLNGIRHVSDFSLASFNQVEEIAFTRERVHCSDSTESKLAGSRFTNFCLVGIV